MQRQPVYSQAPENMVWYDAVEQAVEYEFPKQEASLQKCLDELIEIQRLCVCAFYYENQSYKEIAEKTPEEIGKVRSFIQNGKRNLRICMEKGNANQA